MHVTYAHFTPYFSFGDRPLPGDDQRGDCEEASPSYVQHEVKRCEKSEDARSVRRGASVSPLNNPHEREGAKNSIPPNFLTIPSKRKNIRISQYIGSTLSPLIYRLGRTYTSRPFHSRSSSIKQHKKLNCVNPFRIHLWVFPITLTRQSLPVPVDLTAISQDALPVDRYHFHPCALLFPATRRFHLVVSFLNSNCNHFKKKKG